MEEVWYRYIDERGTNGPLIYELKFKVISQTDKTVLIDYYGTEKRVLKNARKRFAYPTKAEAWESYGKRKEWQKRYAMSALNHSSDCLALHAKGFENLDQSNNFVFEF